MDCNNLTSSTAGADPSFRRFGNSVDRYGGTAP
eukprot:CAMPEP_0204154828 /NCGR_PEP_ID=MMETSP0361-20130328/29060_1 /ASSEMBLY_ACC=CAM_ASM_000343 /TAXON_ID=268821 /ORGANISM="Scrippsiella Hangoei, Strain SHTV-5" /LENGTH=32 /DNA_ID= /DNA_START= /DNA_END= /DNA_ORIENTATION=